MAILQRTLASGSLWIGTGSNPALWSGYNGVHNVPFSIINNDYTALGFNSSNTTNILYLNTTSIRSANYISGFDPTNQGNRGFAIDLIDGRYVAQFDDLWVRGVMNVHQFVINQIRATNGSLWVSDAAKATSASSTSVGLILSFESGSALPFVQGDIIRSKRWVVTQTQISNWDVVTVVNSIDYANYNLTGSLAGITYWTASPQSLGNLTQSAGSDWVRIGHTSSTSRQGGIYLTSGDKGSPYIDIYDSVSTVAGGHYNDSGSVDYTSSNVLKLRLGKLTGINTTLFGQLQGYGLYADNAYLKGKIWANEGGNIAGWTIAPHTLSNNQFRLVSTDSVAYLGIGAQTYTSNGIWIGSSSLGAQLSVGDADSYVRWDGSNLSISTPNLSVIGGNVSMSATVSATAGLIGGWNIGATSLYSGLVTISSLSTNRYFGIGTATYLGSGIYIGSSSNKNLFSITDGISGIAWNGSDIGITTSNFTLSGGNITAKGGTIAAWSIGEDSMSATTALSSLILRNEPSSAWNIVDSGGYQYSWQDGAYFNWKGKYFSTGSSYEVGKSPWVAISNTSSVSSAGIGGQTNIGFTISAAGMDKTLVTWNDSHTDRDKITALPGETIHIIINTMSVANTTAVPGRVASPFDLLQLNLINKTPGTTRSVLHSFLLPEIGQTTVYTQNEQIYPGVFATSFTNNSTTGETYSILISVTSSIRGTVGNESLPNFNYNLVIKGLGVGSAKGYTELNSQGLLVYAGPSNFLKISTDQLSGATSGSNLGIIAVDTIVGGNTTYGYSGGGGTSGGIDGEGTSGTLSLWQDTNTIGDSIISQQNSATVSVAGTVSAAAFSGSGFALPDDYIPTRDMGYFPAGTSLLKGKNLLQAIEDAFKFAVPEVTNDIPTYVTSGSATLFIKPATETTVTKTWNQQFQLPASMSAVSYGASCSSMTITYTNHGNIAWTASDTRYVTNSYGAATVTPTYTNVINHAKIYLFNSTQSTTLTIPGFSFTASYAGTTTDLSRSLTPIKDFVGTSTIRDILGNAVSVTLTDRTVGTAVSTVGQGKYGVRFFLVKSVGPYSTSGVEWQSLNASTLTNITTIGGWGTYSESFTNSVPYLHASATNIQAKNLTFNNCFSSYQDGMPIGIVMLAPSTVKIFNDDPSKKYGYWKKGSARAKCRMMSSTNNYENGTASVATFNTTQYYLYNMNNSIGDPNLALSDADGVYTKTWLNTLTSNMKLFFVHLQGTNESAVTLTWDAT